MIKQELIKMASEFIETSEDNYIKKENAISDITVGMKIFEAPILAFGDAEDEYFTRLKDPVAIGSHFKLPKEWLPQGKTVISYFLPFTETVKRGNSLEVIWPSQEWLHGRYEGQMLLNKLSLYLQRELINAGYQSIAPSQDEGFWSKRKPVEGLINEDYYEPNLLSFTSNWSERHVAFVCGLGTFGLSKGLITKKGLAGRFGSIVTELQLTPNAREYEDIYEYCSECGVCITQCPVNAISFENGKNHHICCEFVDETKIKYKPRYGCGKCQVSVPCESCIPI
ncbi:MAG: 4Fe-4S ferredoxin [Clostridiaceae bacterium BRH_c20a]|nr:MAG: 4Fe-4S ferredoxin [Clostridiaceae bacterium BRH_c20a]